MEEYEVRNFYYRKGVVDLFFVENYIVIYDGYFGGDLKKYFFELFFFVINKSNVVEKEYKMNILFEGIDGIGFLWDRENFYIMMMIIDSLSILMVNMVFVFFNEEFCIMRFKLNMLDKWIEKNLLNGKMILKFYYSLG